MFANISEEVKSSSKLRNSVAGIVETDLEKFKSLSGFLYVSNGTVKSNPCYRTSRQCVNGTNPVASDVIHADVVSCCIRKFLANLPNSLKTTQYFYPDPQYHQIFQGRSAHIQRKIDLISHPVPALFCSLPYHRRELFRISYYLVALMKQLKRLFLKALLVGNV